MCIYIIHIGCFVAFQFLEKAANVAKRVYCIPQSNQNFQYYLMILLTSDELI